ncbi:MAG: murein transglycosylase domain-containing protein [Rikenellaceae bacterium]
MKHILKFAPVLLLLTLSDAEAQGDFDALADSFNSAFESINSEFDSAVEDMNAQYDKFQAQIEAEYNSFIGEVEGQWGEGNAPMNDQHTWVEYGDDLSSRSVVDFESGKVEVEVLLTEEEAADEKIVEQKLNAAVEKMLTSKGQSVDYDSKYIPKEEISKEEIMNDLVDIRSLGITRQQKSEAPADAPAPSEDAQTQAKNAALKSEIERLKIEAAGADKSLAEAKKAALARAEAELKAKQEAEAKQKAEAKAAKERSDAELKAKELAAAIVAANKKEVTTVKSDSGEKRVVKVSTNMKVGYMSDLAKRYESSIMSNAKRFDIDPTLVLAVMETESYFSPTATSNIPAFGLMQIVPKYAGKDAYKHIYGQDRLLSKDYLYKPDQNIEIGVGYLHILESRYFSKVTDKRSRELCMIAAYNTGAGNVSRAMAGHTNIFKVISQINEMSYEQLYEHLSKNLPYAETQNYIKKVSTKRVKYQ